jgi:hypothetical protein
MMDKPNYNQTEVFLYHYNAQLKPLETELTGIMTSSHLLVRPEVEHQAFLTSSHLLVRPEVEHQAF